MKQLRICHVITRLDKGGSAENTLLTVLGNCDHGHHVELLCGVSDNPPSENESLARQQGAVICTFKNMVREISPCKDMLTMIQLWWYLKKNHFDVLHTHTSKAGIVARIAGWLAGVRCVIHTPHGHIFYGYFSPRKTAFLIGVERLISKKSSAIITLTNGERKDYLDRKIGTPDSIVPILSGINLAPFLSDAIDKSAVRRELGLPLNGFIAGTVARLVSVKNHDVIVSAAEIIKDQAPDLLFVFAGDGDLRDHLEKRIAQAGLSQRFLFLGWSNDTPKILKALDLFVMCSHNEGMGRAFVEAQASGVPVIGSRVGGIPEVLIEGKTGYMVPPDDASALAECIMQLYNDSEKRQQMSMACREWVNPRFGHEVMVRAIEKLYKQYL